uniref:Uncharacterized protein n=1 Tax=Salix viminalis TaxID=40686 RepID=A0A6N2NL03_SALVM
MKWSLLKRGIGASVDGGGFWWSLVFNPIALWIGNLDDAAAAINGLLISFSPTLPAPKDEERN